MLLSPLFFLLEIKKKAFSKENCLNPHLSTLPSKGGLQSATHNFTLSTYNIFSLGEFL